MESGHHNCEFYIIGCMDNRMDEWTGWIFDVFLGNGNGNGNQLGLYAYMLATPPPRSAPILPWWQEDVPIGGEIIKMHNIYPWRYTYTYIRCLVPSPWRPCWPRPGGDPSGSRLPPLPRISHYSTVLRIRNVDCDFFGPSGTGSGFSNQPDQNLHHTWQVFFLSSDLMCIFCCNHSTKTH